AGGIQMDQGRLVGSPERINLFTIEGDLLRVDLDLEAHLGSTLQPSSVLVLEKASKHSQCPPSLRVPSSLESSLVRSCAGQSRA
ncbi:MAG: hypothetical protein SGPRY_012844, partial [Prymnesium sp.]